MAAASTSVAPEAESDLLRWRRNTRMLVREVCDSKGVGNGSPGAVVNGVASADAESEDSEPGMIQCQTSSWLQTVRSSGTNFRPSTVHRAIRHGIRHG